MISVDIARFPRHLRAAALPGGRVKPGEDARTILVREMQEELAELVEVDELLYLVENFFTHADKPNHEIGIYFRARLQRQSAILDMSGKHWGIENHRKLEFQWFACEQLDSIDLHPSFLRQALAKRVLQFEHVVQRPTGSAT